MERRSKVEYNAEEAIYSILDNGSDSELAELSSDDEYQDEEDPVLHETEALEEETVNETGCGKSNEADKDEEAQVDETIYKWEKRNLQWLIHPFQVHNLLVLIM